jgi:DNA-binding LacI/PurR family transcriptional regulator
VDLVAHLVGLGHRAIAHVAGSSAPARRRGYERSMDAHGLGAHIEVAHIDVEGGEADSGGYEAALRLLDRVGRPTAILAVSDLVALGVLAAAHALGLRVPQDLSAVGFDGTSLAGLRGVGLTTISRPHPEMPAAMTACLLGRIDDDGEPGPPIRHRVPPTSTVRGTTAQAPDAS